MSSGTVNAKNAKKKAEREKENPAMTIYMGIFIDSPISNGIAAKMAHTYKFGQDHNDNVKWYSMNITVETVESYKILKDGITLEESYPYYTMAQNVVSCLSLILSNATMILNGFSKIYETTVYFDIGGVDEGCIVASELSEIVTNKKYDEGILENYIKDAWPNSQITELYSTGARIKEGEISFSQTKQSVIESYMDSEDSDGYTFTLNAVENNRVGIEYDTQIEMKEVTSVWDTLQNFLDVVGMVPGFGEIADGLNVMISLGRGRWGDAALSFAAMCPIAGNAATTAKWAKKGKKIVNTVADAPKSIKSTKKTRIKAIEEDNNVIPINIKTDEKKVISLAEKRDELMEIRNKSIIRNGTDGGLITSPQNSIGPIGGGCGYNYGIGSGSSNNIYKVHRVNGVRKINSIHELNEGIDSSSSRAVSKQEETKCIKEFKEIMYRITNFFRRGNNK